jgi:16S rRNA (uracil1498-N3)-methyltransferase
MDLLLRQLTELGITGWQPFISQRSVPQPDVRRQAGRAERWERIAREAVKQCRRGRVPDLAGVGQFGDVLQNGARFDQRILFWEGARQALPPAPETIPTPPRKILVVVGPEGGFTETEAARAEECGFRLTALGPRILRAETAAVAACALVQHLYGDLGRVLAVSDAEARGGGDSETL